MAATDGLDPEDITKTRYLTRRCKGKSRNTGERCRRPAMRGSNYCQWHGGRIKAAMKKGAGHNRFVNGKYSSLLPDNLRATYEDGLEDPRLLELREEIALIDARLVQLVGRIGTGESNGVWNALQANWREFMNAVRTGNVANQNELLPTVNMLITRGAADTAQWEEVEGLQEHRRKMVESEQRRMQIAQQMIGVEQVVVLMNATITYLKEAVTRYADDETADKILADANRSYNKLLGSGNGSTANIIDIPSKK